MTRRAPALLACAVLALGACLPEDESVERGAIYVQVSLGPAVRDYGSVTVTFDRVVLLAGGAAPDCHVTYYVDRPPPSYALVDLARPFVFEHRGIDETFCKVNTGFIRVESPPQRGPGVTDVDVALLYSPDRETGAAHVLAHADVRLASGRVRTVRYDLVYTDLRGSELTTTDVKSGDRVDIGFTYDTRSIADRLLATPALDRNLDGVITVDELDPQSRENLRVTLSNAWELSWRR